MAQMEQESRKRRKKQNMQRALLLTLATAGLVAWAVMAPNALRLLKYLPGDPIRYRLRTAAGKLVAKKYAVWVKRNDSYGCEEFIALLKAELKIGRSVLYVIADSIEQDKILRSHFNLPSA